jgi:hypothetical protein
MKQQVSTKPEVQPTRRVVFKLLSTAGTYYGAPVDGKAPTVNSLASPDGGAV